MKRKQPDFPEDESKNKQKKEQSESEQDNEPDPMKTEWEIYTKNVRRCGGVSIAEGAKRYTAPSYSHYFFRRFKIHPLLLPANPIVQFGASTGAFLKEHLSTHPVIGYDYHPAAIEALKQFEIPCKRLDLNNTQAVSQALAVDVGRNSPVNYILVRILQYLKPEAVISLLDLLMNHAPPGSRFFISNSLPLQPGEIGSLVKCYVTTFFGVRTDFEILFADETIQSDKDHDEVVVIQKRSN